MIRRLVGFAYLLCLVTVFVWLLHDLLALPLSVVLFWFGFSFYFVFGFIFNSICLRSFLLHDIYY